MPGLRPHNRCMRLVIALCLAAAPAFAQDTPSAPKTADDGFSLMEEGMKLVMRGVMTEMQPALDEMGKALDQMEPHLQELGPKLQDLIALIDDIRNYDAPVMLPNGDILIRRNAPLAPQTDLQPGPNGEIDL
jgi:hypothetical protein